jgi:mRNA-degrading endonuclease RelE of RelBE toxin-antitoxin system
VRRALRDLARERGDIKALEAPLEGSCRLRVGGYRIGFAYGKRQTIECVFAEQRSVVYEMLLQRLRDRLREGEE